MVEMWDIPEVPLFQAGTRHGEEWTEQDLLDMARNHKVLRDRLQPTMGTDHPTSGGPRLGTPDNVKVGYEIVDGNPVATLYGDLTKIPPALAEPIRAGLFDAVSIEADRVSIEPSVYDAPPEGCEHVKGPILQGVAVLGRNLPQVKGLESISRLLNERGHLTHSQFSEKLLARPRVTLRATNVRKSADGTRILSVFSEVIPVRVKQKPEAKSIKPVAQWSANGRAAWKKFSEATEAPAMSRDELRSILIDCGYSEEELPDTIPDATLAAMIRVHQMAIQQANEAKPTPEPEENGQTEEPEKKTSEFSEAAIVARLTKKFESQIDKLRQELAGAEASVTATSKIAKQTEADTKRAGAKTFCEALSTQGKLPPAILPRAIDLLAQADAVTVHQFSEGKRTLHDELRAFMESFPAKHFGEKIPTQHADDEKATQDAETAKVREHYSSSAAKDLLKSMRRTPDHYVSMFSERLKAEPKLTAEEFLRA